MSVYRPPTASPPMPPPHPSAMGHHPMMPYPPMGPYGPPPHYMPAMPYPHAPPPPLTGQMGISAPIPPPPPPPPPPKEISKPEEKNDDETKKEDEKKKGGEGDSKSQEGLELLASLAAPSDAAKKANGESPSDNKEGDEAADKVAQLHANAEAAGIAIVQMDGPTTSKKPRKKSKMEEMTPKEKLFVEKVRDCDVLCGRGGKSNHHPGNKRYRQVVSEMKRTYQSTGAKTAKTDLSRAIVEHVVGYGGRFVKKEDSTGQYFLLTKAQARRKTSQALRETKELKWTM